jgi:hypothetical protein
MILRKRQFPFPFLLAALLILSTFALAQPGPPPHAQRPAHAGPPAQAGPPAFVNPGPPSHAGPPAVVPPVAVPPVVVPPVVVPPVTEPEPDPETPAPAPTATVNILHGIPGTPVTVCVNGAAAIDEFDYKNITTVSLEEGAYDVAIVGGFFGDCSTEEPLLGPATLELDGGVNYSVIAHLTEDGEPTVSVFVNSQSPTLPGYARVVLHHTAAAPPVQAKIGRLTESALDIVTGAIANVSGEGAEDPFSGQIRPGNWQFELLLADDPLMSVFGPFESVLRPHTAYLIYAVGDAADVELLVIELPVGIH